MVLRTGDALAMTQLVDVDVAVKEWTAVVLLVLVEETGVMLAFVWLVAVLSELRAAVVGVIGGGENFAARLVFELVFLVKSPKKVRWNFP